MPLLLLLLSLLGLAAAAPPARRSAQMDDLVGFGPSGGLLQTFSSYVV